ncbi:MAG TPA: DUF2179 domain-containing protein [Longimicrobiales bacterium]
MGMESLDPLFSGPWGPLLIFCLRIFDVSISTIRVLLAVRSHRMAVPVLGFFEVSVWIIAVGSAIRNLESIWHVLGYAGGFAAGNFVGLWIEEKLAFGYATVRIVSTHGGVELAEALRDRGFGVTEFSGHGREGPVEVVYTVLRRRDVPQIFEEVERWDPQAFVTVEEPRQVRSGWRPARRRRPLVRAGLGFPDRR